MDKAKVEEAATRLIALRTQMVALSSLRPGEGYDDIGAELCGLVFRDYTPKEKEAIIALLEKTDPTVITDIRRVSIASEMEMERAVLDGIFAQPDAERLPPAMADAGIIEKLRHVTRAYPYSWGFSRAEEQLEFIESIEGRKVSAQDDMFLLHGRTMLPWSGLSLHLLTGAPVVWIDRFADSASYAQRFITILEDLEIIQPGQFTVLHEDDEAQIESALAGAAAKRIFSFILDKDYDVSAVYNRFHRQGVHALMLTETHGLTQLMYPPYDLGKLKGLFNLQAVLMPLHAAGTHSFPDDVRVVNGTRADVFLSTMYFKLV